ncbi:MAG: VWA domain-containing protein [Thermoanaerobaculia bacterium]
MMKLTRTFTACLLLLWSASAFAQKAAQPAPAGVAGEPGFYVESVNVNVVNVDVYVTDKSGKRIQGLTQNDFEIYENGKKVAVTNFYAVEGGKAKMIGDEPVAAPAAADTPGRPAAPAQPAPLPEDQRLRLVVYIDNFNLHPFNRNRVMRELRAFLGQKLSRDDQVMLVTYDRELHVRRTFTSDPGLINDSLLELEKISAQAVHADSERRDALRNIEESRSAVEALGYARSYAQSTFNDLSFSISALKDLVGSLAGMPGRKAILYVSDGLQMIAGQDVYYAVQSKYGEQSTGLTESMQFDTSRRFTELTATANANRVTFYTIDAAGLRVYSSISAENATAGQGVYVDSIQISNLQAPLQMLAEKTGGVAIINANQVGPHLEKLAQDFGTYYSLGYSPTHYGDGRYYKIEVKVKQKGYQVRHREGYRDKSPDSRMTDGTLAALNFPFEDNKFGVELEFGQPAPREGGHFLVPVVVKIPIGKLVLVPREQTQEARVRLYIAAMDEKGGVSDVQQVQLPISIPAAEVAAAVGKHYAYSVNLLMRRGDQKVAVGVRDDVAGESSFVSRTLRVGTQVSSSGQ